MTVVWPCPKCEGKGKPDCTECGGRGYRTSTDVEPPVIPRKSDGKLPPVQLELPV